MRKLLAGLVLAFAAACGGDGGSGPNSEHTGTYALQTANGSALPFVIEQQGANKAELTGGFLNLNADGTFTTRADFRLTINGAVTTTQAPDNGTYTRTGNNISFRGSAGDTYSAAYSGNSLTMVDDGLTLVFRK